MHCTMEDLYEYVYEHACMLSALSEPAGVTAAPSELLKLWSKYRLDISGAERSKRHLLTCIIPKDTCQLIELS